MIRRTCDVRLDEFATNQAAHGAKLDEHGAKLDAILELVRRDRPDPVR